MDLYVAELFDYDWEKPMLVGIYDSEDKAEKAIAIVLRRYREKEPDYQGSRFVQMVTTVQLNGFCPEAIDHLGWEGL